MNEDLHPLTNFSPIGAMALFGAAYFKSPGKAYGFPLLTLLVSDVVLSLTVYKEYSHGILYSGWYWVYAAFALMVMAGKLLIKEITAKNILIAALSITFIHWIVSDMGSTYPKTFTGLWACLAAAIPFERNFLAGTLVYGAVMFGAFEWLLKKYQSLKLV
jgi:hypothetical protein